MAIHLVQDAQGRVHEIEAPDNASQDDILNFASQTIPIGGSSPLSQEQYKPQLSDYHMKDGAIPALVGGTLAFGQGGMPVFDEAGAAVGAGLESAGFPYGKINEPSLSKNYDTRLQNIRNTEQAFANDHPIANTGLRLAGGVTATLPFAGSLAARPILGGATYGATQGFAGADGNGYNRLFSGAVGGILGAGTSAIAKTLITPSVKLGDKLINGADKSGYNKFLNKKDLAPIFQKLDEAGVTPQQYAQNLANSAPNQFAGEVGGENLASYAMSNAKTANAGMQQAKEAMQLRLKQAPQESQQIIEDAFYPSSSKLPVVGADLDLSKSAPSDILPVTQMGENLSGMKNTANEMYALADSQTAPTSGLLEDLNTVQGQEAMARLMRRPSIQKMHASDAGIILDPETGFRGLSKEVPVSTLKLFAQELGDNAERNNLGEVTTGLGLEEQAQGVHANEYIGSKVPEYAKAVQNAAGNFQGTAAFEQGRKLAHSAAGDMADALKSRADEIFSPNELAFQKAGYVQGLSDKALGGIHTINKPIVTKTASDFIGNTGAEDLANALAAQKQRIDFANKGLNNSVTSEVRSNQEANFPTSAHSLVHALLGKAKEFISPDRTADIASYLYATSPETKQMFGGMLQNNAYYPRYLLDKPLAATALDIAPTMAAQYPMLRYNSPTSQGGQ